MSKPKYLILLAGYPATGKTTFIKEIIKWYPEIAIITPDEFKEKLWINKGFSNINEKNMLVQDAWVQYFEELEKMMSENEIVLSEYPFSNQQIVKLTQLCEKYSVTPLTIRLIAEFDTLFQRHQERDKKWERHPVYVIDSYIPGEDVPKDREQKDGVDMALFRDRYLNKGYGKFQLGNLFEIDTTQFLNINFNALNKWLQRNIK